MNNDHYADVMHIVVPGLPLTAEGRLPRELRRGLDHAAEIAQDVPEARYIVSGGAPRCNRTQAHVMQEYLEHRHHVPHDHIIPEPASETMYEHALFVRKLMEEPRYGIERIVVATTPARALCASFCFGLIFEEPVPISTPYASIPDALRMGLNAWRIPAYIARHLAPRLYL